MSHRLFSRQLRSRVACQAAGRKRRLTAEWLESRNLLASVAGTVFEDTDLDGAFDIGERPLAGRTVYVDLNRNGRFDAPSEPSQITGSDGIYVLNDLPADQTDVGLLEKFGFEQTAPQKMAAQIREIPMQVDHMVYSEANGKLYASGSLDIESPSQTIFEIDPVAGAITSSVFVGQRPGQLAVSDDGHYLYAALRDEAAVQRVDLTTMTPDLRFPLGSGISGAFYALDLDVMPGNSHAVAVSRYNQSGSSPNFEGVAIYDDGVPRPQATSRRDISEFIEFSNSETTLYGLNTSLSGHTFYRMQVTSAGVTIVDSIQGLLDDGDFRFEGGLLYSARGRVVDPSRLNWLGTYDRTNETPDFIATVPDPQRDLAFIVTEEGLDAFDQQSYGYLDSLTLPALNSATIASYGHGGLALDAVGRLLLVQWDPRPARQSVALNSEQDLVGVDFGSHAVAAPGTIRGQVFHDVDATGTRNLSEPGLAGWTVFLDQNGNSQLDAGERSTISDEIGHYEFGGLEPGSYRVMEVAQAQWEQTLPAPQPAHAQQIQFPANEITYDPTRGKIYASVPGRAPVVGNSVTEIDPLTGAVGRSVFVGSEPREMAISDDGKYLYVILRAASEIARIDLAAFTVDLRFSLDADLFGVFLANSIAVMPGHSESVAVSQNQGPGRPGYAAIYDNGVRRSQTTQPDFGPYLLAFSDDANLLYGWYGMGLARMAVTTSGVSITDVVKDVIGSYGFEYQNGRIYTETGRVVDPLLGSVVGTFGPVWTLEPDSSAGILYVAVDSVVKAYDISTLSLLDTLQLPGIVFRPEDLISWGPNRLAFTTDTGQISIFEWNPRNPFTDRTNLIHLGAGQTIESADFANRNLAPENVPNVAPDTYDTQEDVVLNVSAEAGVLANDGLAEQSSFSAVVVAGPSQGTLTLQPDGSFSYVPKANYNGSDSFTYRVYDNQAVSDIATVTINIASVPDAPVAVNNSYIVFEDTPRSFSASMGVLANDTDGDKDPLTAVLESGPVHGTLTLNANGSFSYAPDRDFRGSDRFTYHASDGTLTSNVATVSLIVNGVNDAPSGADRTVTMAEDTIYTFKVADFGFSDPSDTPANSLLAVRITTLPAAGRITVNGVPAIAVSCLS